MNSRILVGLDGSDVVTCCPTQRWLAEIYSPILVGIDVLGVEMCCPGEENELIWYEEGITVAIVYTGILWLGLLGMMAITREGLAFMAIKPIPGRIVLIELGR